MGGSAVGFDDEASPGRQLQLMRYVVLRFTWRQVPDESDVVAATIAGILAQGGAVAPTG